MADHFRPMLGAKATGVHEIQLPCFASYKLDGWRGIWQGLEFFSRNGKTIPNRALQRGISQLYLPVGSDGEIIVGEPNAPDVFSKTDKFCKRASASTTEGVRFFVFDNALDSRPYWRRYGDLYERPPGIIRLDQILIETYEELEEFEANAVAQGYEGICTRSPNSRYKNGRSTIKEQYLVKLKRYIDEECKIIRLEEKQHNANPAVISETGYAKRSSHKEGKVPAGTTGAFVVDWRGKELHVGTGFDAGTALDAWRNPDKYIGKFATIKYSPVLKDLPRHPVWKGIPSDR